MSLAFLFGQIKYYKCINFCIELPSNNCIVYQGMQFQKYFTNLSAHFTNYFTNLVGLRTNNAATQYTCMDESLAQISGSGAGNGGYYFYTVEALCNQFIPCSDQEVTCVVCTK